MSLFYFTESYPYGIGQEWKLNELKALAGEFKSIVIIPLASDENSFPEYLVPDGVNLIPPLFKKNPIYLQYSAFDKIVSVIKSPFSISLQEFFSSNLFSSRNKLSAFLHACHYISIIKKHPDVQKIINNLKPDDILYFFWGRGVCEIIPFIDTRGVKLVVRLHGFDLYEDRNNGYIPFRGILLKKVNSVLLVSSFGKKYLSNIYPKLAFKFFQSYLGTGYLGRAKASQDNILRIASCGRVIPLKRYSIIVEALHYLDIKVDWHHLGDGPLLETLINESKKLPGNIQSIFHGWVKASEVKKFYLSTPIDLFINVSETEGLPVSIMEAMSCGIPVFATDVGGTSEIVDNSVGGLLPSNVTPLDLAKLILDFSISNPNKKEEIRDNAFKRFKEKCDAQSLSKELTYFLKSHV